MPDRIDLKNVKAKARDFSMTFPEKKGERFMLFQKIAKEIQSVHGSFFFDQIYDVLEQVYSGEFEQNINAILSELEEWVQCKCVELLSDDNGFYTYRLKF